MTHQHGSDVESGDDVVEVDERSITGERGRIVRTRGVTVARQVDRDHRVAVRQSIPAGIPRGCRHPQAMDEHDG